MYCGAVLRTCVFNLADWDLAAYLMTSLTFASCVVIYILAHVVVSSLFCSLGIPPWSPQRNDLNPFPFLFSVLVFLWVWNRKRCQPNRRTEPHSSPPTLQPHSHPPFSTLCFLSCFIELCQCFVQRHFYHECETPLSNLTNLLPPRLDLRA